MTQILLLVLALCSIFFVLTWIQTIKRAQVTNKEQSQQVLAHKHTLFELAVGFITNLLDTLGIGSFATTSSIFKLKRMVPDELIPGTLNVGHCLPTVAEAFIFIAIVQVDASTLLFMIIASVLGAWLGAGIVSKWPRRLIQVSLGLALCAAAILMLLTQLSLLPAGGEQLGLKGTKLYLGIFGNFVLGALMTLGIGLYAPCMILVSLLGMNPRAAFPIMMGSCAFLMTVSSTRFILSHRYDLKTAQALSIGGIPGVIIAAFVIKSLPLTMLRWLVICVVLYTAFMLLRSVGYIRANNGQDNL